MSVEMKRYAILDVVAVLQGGRILKSIMKPGWRVHEQCVNGKTFCTSLCLIEWTDVYFLCSWLHGLTFAKPVTKNGSKGREFHSIVCDRTENMPGKESPQAWEGIIEESDERDEIDIEIERVRVRTLLRLN